MRTKVRNLFYLIWITNTHNKILVKQSRYAKQTTDLDKLPNTTH